MKNLYVVLSVVLFSGILILTLPASAQQTHTRNITLCAVDMSYAELATLVKRMREFHENVNHDISGRHLREVLTLQDGLVTLESRNDFTLIALENGPEVATTVWYRMTIDDTAPISSIDLHFQDYKRKVTVSGTDRDLVHGLLLVISEEVERVACSFGGGSTRGNFGFGIWGLGALLAFGSFMLIRLRRNATSGHWIPLFASGISVVLFVIVLALPWDDWLPGTAIRLHPRSTWNQISPFVAVFGLLFSFVSVSLSFVFFFGRRRGQSDG